MGKSSTGKKLKLRGKLVTFEGTEGAGKSTLIRAIAAQLTQEGIPVISTREPGGSPVAEQIRKVILENPMNPWTELFLYEAARAEHLAQTILPALQQGAIVLCDRYTDSTLAYQGTARGLPRAEIRTLNRLATRAISPHLTVWVDIDPAKGLRRAADPNRFEQEGFDFQNQVRKGFAQTAREEPKRWWKIEANSGTPEEMAKRVVAQLRKKKVLP